MSCFRQVIIPDGYIFRGKKFDLYLTKEQEEYLELACELYRYIYNWTLETKEKMFELHKLDPENNSILTYFSASKLMVKMKKETPWLQRVPNGTLRNAINDAINAYKKWFNKLNKKPKFKTKKNSKLSFSPRADRCYIIDNMLKIEGLSSLISIKWHSGWTKADEKALKYTNVRVFKDSDGKWKVSFNILRPYKKSKYYDPKTKTYTPDYPRAIGFDFNKENLIVDSFGEGNIHKLPKAFKKSQKRTKLLSKQIIRDNKLTIKNHPEITNWEKERLSDYKSNRAKKRQIKYNKSKKRSSYIIENYAHEVFNKLVDKFPVAIVTESLSTSNMHKIHTVSRGLAGIPFYKMKRMLKSKCEERGIPFIEAERTYPSTQRCSYCGHIQKMYSKHTYKCPVCGLIMDRDINAAFNLEQLAYKDYVQDALIWV